MWAGRDCSGFYILTELIMTLREWNLSTADWDLACIHSAHSFIIVVFKPDAQFSQFVASYFAPVFFLKCTTGNQNSFSHMPHILRVPKPVKSFKFVFKPALAKKKKNSENCAKANCANWALGLSTTHIALRPIRIQKPPLPFCANSFQLNKWNSMCTLWAN